MNTTVNPTALFQEAPDDRRAYRRHALRVAILVTPMNAGDSEGRESHAPRQTAFTGDVSLSGLQFQSRIPYTVGRLVSIHFTIGVKPYRVAACVKRSRPIRIYGRLRYDCAIQFVHGQDVNAFIPALAKYLSRKASPDLKGC
jgi:hypothetical protein